MLGVDEAVAELQARSLPVESYQPGLETMINQIAVFSKCRGIVFIKGAECSHLIWLKPKSRVVMIRPSDYLMLPVQQSMARLLDMDYEEIETPPGSYPELTSNEVVNWLT